MSGPPIRAGLSQGGGARPTPKLPAWYMGYCALALFNVAILFLSLWLNSRGARLLDTAAQKYGVYADLLERVNSVAKFAVAAHVPGNAVFSSRDAPVELQRLDAVAVQFGEHYAGLQAAIAANLPSEAQSKIIDNVTALKSETEFMVTEARLILAAFVDGRSDAADRHVAVTSKRFGNVARHLFATTQTIRREQLAVIATQRTEASEAQRLAAAMVIVAVLLTFAAAVHAWRVHRAMRVEASEREHHMRQLTRARDQAEQAARAKAQFLATMSHEIRTPMNGLLGMLDALSATPLSQAQAGILKTANSSGDLLLSIIDDVLDFSLIDAGMLSIHTAPFDVHELAQRAVALYAAQAREKMLSLKLEMPASPVPQVAGDAMRLSQVIGNFLGNAVKFTAAGAITLRVEVLNEDAEAMRIKFSVQDTGIGIDTDKQSKLFAPFTQGDAASNRRYGGTGLGLALCKQLAKLLDPQSGEIGVTSTLGSGSSFYVSLRLARAADQPHAMPASVAQVGGIGTQKFAGHVLVVEDNETNRQVVVTMLRNLGVQMTLAGNGREAIEAVHRERYDLILMDYHMPELDGCDATVGIRRYEREHAHARTPIIAVTASVLASDRERCFAAGMDDFVAKPLRQRMLTAMLEKWLPENARRDAIEQHDASSDDPLTRTWTNLPVELFDLEQLLEMRAIAGESFDELIEQFHGSAIDGLASIRNAVESGDSVALKRAAHKLKGAAATLGAKLVAERCHALEMAGKEQRMDAAAEHLHCLEQEYIEVRRHMSACAQHQSASAA